MVTDMSNIKTKKSIYDELQSDQNILQSVADIIIYGDALPSFRIRFLRIIPHFHLN